MVKHSMDRDHIAVLDSAQPRKNTVETLERMLADAKTGRLQNFTGVAEYTEGDQDHIYTGTYDYARLLGALTWSRHRIMKMMDKKQKQERF